MADILKKIIGDMDAKKEYKAYKKRISELPDGYRDIFEEIEKYMMHFGNGNEEFMKTLYNLLDMFEESAAENKNIMDIVGNDIGTFCEDILKAVPEITWENDYKKKLQRRLNEKIDNSENKK